MKCMVVIEDLSNLSNSARCYMSIEPDWIKLDLRSGFSTKESSEAENIFESHVWPDGDSMRLHVRPIHCSHQSAKHRDQLELAPPWSMVCSWLRPASVVRPHCSRLRKPPVLNWWACALQFNQHSWSVTELQTYIQSRDLSPYAWLVASR